MEFIAHQINTIEELKCVPKEYGVEVDLRDHGNRLILQHDPFKDGEDFEDYLKYYDHGTMILNIKSERIEFRVLELLKKYKVERYFFLDSSFPMVYLLSEQGEKNIALRFSEFEGLDTIMNMKDRINWVWVDCFRKFPMDNISHNIFTDIGLKLCLVSPELQNRRNELKPCIKTLQNGKIKIDAVCSKIDNYNTWNDLAP